MIRQVHSDEESLTSSWESQSMHSGPNQQVTWPGTGMAETQLELELRWEPKSKSPLPSSSHEKGRSPG